MSCEQLAILFSNHSNYLHSGTKPFLVGVICPPRVKVSYMGYLFNSLKLIFSLDLTWVWNTYAFFLWKCRCRPNSRYAWSWTMNRRPKNNVCSDIDTRSALEKRFFIYFDSIFGDFFLKIFEFFLLKQSNRTKSQS